MNDTVLQVQGLCKNYPAFTLSEVSFSLEAGRIMGFIGRNGAGKTTLMDVITIYVVPIGAILGAVMAYWVLGIDKMEQELMNGRSKPLSRAFAPLAKYVYIFLAALVVFFSFIIPGGIG